MTTEVTSPMIEKNIFPRMSLKMGKKKTVRKKHKKQDSKKISGAEGKDIDLIEELEKDTKRTSLGEWLVENSKIFFIGVGLISLVAISSVWYSQWEKSKRLEAVDKVYSFREKNFLLDEEGLSDEDKKKAEKITDDQLVEDFKKLTEKISYKAALTPLSIQLAEKIKDKKKSVEILEAQEKQVRELEILSILRVQLASFYEDLGKVDKTVDFLQKVKARMPDYFAPYIYFNLGRLYKDKGLKDKAKSEFDFLIENYADTEEAKLAKILLSEF